jgi:hypothetical protein
MNAPMMLDTANKKTTTDYYSSTLCTLKHIKIIKSDSRVWAVKIIKKTLTPTYYCMLLKKQYLAIHCRVKALADTIEIEKM